MLEEHRAVIEQIKNTPDYFQKAKLIAYLMRDHKVRIKDIAEMLNMTQSYVCHIIRLNKLPELITDGYYSKLITISHLFVLSLLKSEEAMITLYEEILRDSLSVKATEERIRNMVHNVSSEGDYVDKHHIQESTQVVMDKYSAKVKLIQTRIKTKLILEWTGSRKDRHAKVKELLTKLSQI